MNQNRVNSGVSRKPSPILIEKKRNPMTHLTPPKKKRK